MLGSGSLVHWFINSLVVGGKKKCHADNEGVTLRHSKGERKGLRPHALPRTHDWCPHQSSEKLSVGTPTTGYYKQKKGAQRSL